MQSFVTALGKFFGVFLRGQTYLNALYLLLAFPLGLFYFVFLVVGIAVGVPLIIVWVGLLILALVFALWFAFIVFERQMAISMLREDIPPITRRDLSEKSLWQKFTATLGNPVTWKGLVYLLAKFPIGVISFVFLVSFLSVSAALIGAPFYYNQWDAHVRLDWGWNNIWIVDTLPEALLVCLIGLLVLLISMHIFNGLAWVQGRFARVMLGNFSPAPAAAVAAPVEPAPVAVVAAQPADAPVAPAAEPSPAEESPTE